MGKALDQTVAGEKKTLVLMWERSYGVEHLKLFSSHVSSLRMKPTRENNGNVRKDKDACNQVARSLQVFASRCDGVLPTRFYNSSDEGTFIACLDISERHLNFNLACCSI